MRAYARAIFSSYPEILFLRGWGIGAIFCVCTLVKPNVALAGIISVLAAYAFARLVQMAPEFLGSGYYTYNPLLVGLSLGFIFEITPLTVLFIVSAGVLTLLLTVVMAHVFQTWLRIPILSMPFVIASSIAYLASLRYSNLMVAEPHVLWIQDTSLDVPLWLSGYFQSFGAVLFIPNIAVGLVFSVLVLCHSRILFLLSLMGYFLGASVRALMLGSAAQAFGDLNSFNFILIAMAVGGIFLVPSPRSYLLATIAVVLSGVFLDCITVFWAQHGIPVFALPFNIITLGLVYVLGLLGYRNMVQCFGRNPEETLEHHLANQLRYRGDQRTLSLPFSGRWTVWQGFDGKWTHKAGWRYAYDFVITDEEGRTFRGTGERLEDYYCFGKPVLAPVRGRVLKVVDGLPDRLGGNLEGSNNWGNLVIIHDERGFHVEISHLAARSVRVREGDWVERGSVLGLCGSSGYSPQPHIHIQAQLTALVGAGTIPFSFVRYARGNEFHANDLPDENQIVEPLCLDRRMDELTDFVLDDTLTFDVVKSGRSMGRMELTVRIAADGTFYFDSGRGRLYFGKHEGTFYCYRLEGSDEGLRAIFLAIPRLPLVDRTDLVWSDNVPLGLAVPGPVGSLMLFLSSFTPGLARVRSMQAFMGRSALRTLVESRLLKIRRDACVVFDERKGFASVRVDGLELNRVVEEDATVLPDAFVEVTTPDRVSAWTREETSVVN